MSEEMKKPFTENEQVVMDNLVAAWNGFQKLVKQHPSDLDEFIDGLHRCQNVLSLRILRRDYPDRFVSPLLDNKEVGS